MEMSAAEIGNAIGTSDATVIRAVQALGFGSVKELKDEIASSVGYGSTPIDNLVRTLGAIENADAAVGLILSTHADVMASLTPENSLQMQKASGVLRRASSIGCFGIGPSAAIAHYAQVALGRTGRRGILLDA